MSKFNRSEKCSACGQCVAACPMNIIEQDADKHPFLSPENEERCVLCGHCAAICPEEALKLEGPALVASATGDAPETIPQNIMTAYMQSRRSIRRYRSKTVPKELVESLLDAVRYAPTGVNRQEIRFLVVSGGRKVHSFATETLAWARRLVEIKHPIAEQLGFVRLVDRWDRGADPICRNAPMLIIAYAKSDDRMGPADGVIALSHFELAAPAFGLGACWAGYFNAALAFHPPLKSHIGLPADCTALGTLMFGFPAESYVRIPARNAAEVTWVE